MKVYFITEIFAAIFLESIHLDMIVEISHSQYGDVSTTQLSNNKRKTLIKPNVCENAALSCSEKLFFFSSCTSLTYFVLTLECTIFALNKNMRNRNRPNK